MMCLASKVRFLSGKADSPTLSSRTFRFKELDAARKTRVAGIHAAEDTPPLEQHVHEVRIPSRSTLCTSSEDL